MKDGRIDLESLDLDSILGALEAPSPSETLPSEGEPPPSYGFYDSQGRYNYERMPYRVCGRRTCAALFDRLDYPLPQEPAECWGCGMPLPYGGYVALKEKQHDSD